MAKQKKTGTPNTHSRKDAPPQKPPAWGLLVAALSALLFVNAALVIMDKIGIDNTFIRTGIVIFFAAFAGLLARPLTLALQSRFKSEE